MTTCKCGCGTPVPRRRVFLDKEHQLAWMDAGGAAQLNALQPVEAKKRGGRTAGTDAVLSGRLTEAGLRGAETARVVAARRRTGGC
jgi:hypothetical protein